MEGIESVLNSPATWIVVAAASELIGISRLKSNSIIQLVFQGLQMLRRSRGR